MKKLCFSLLVIGALAFGMVGGTTSQTLSATDDTTQVGFPIQPPV
ncbi:hypothetical protein [Neobacillus sp. D3-1R]